VKRRGVFAALLLVLLLTAGTAFADDGPMDVTGTGGAVKPMKSTSIRMAAETVQAICYSRFAEYKIDFVFDNSKASTQTVVLGFPFAGPWDSDDYYHPAAGFQAWQDGRPLTVTLKHGSEAEEPTDFYTHTAVFPPGESTITVSYLIAPYTEGWVAPSAWADEVQDRTPAVYEGEWIGPSSYDYTLHTGSYWAGPIGTAVLSWTLSDDFVGWGIADATRFASELDTSDPETPPTPEQVAHSRIQTNYSIPAPGTYQWVFHSIEPSLIDGESPYDIGLQFLTPPADTEVADTSYPWPDTKASSSLDLGDHKYPASNLVDGDPSTAWAEGAKGSGIGQWVKVTPWDAHIVEELRILPGYAKRPDLFAKYNRPKRLRFDFSDGTSKTVTLADSPTLQRFPVSASIKSARVTILDVYRGTTRNETYISEIEFGAAAAPTFEDPGALLAAAKSLPSADSTPEVARLVSAAASASASIALRTAKAPAAPIEPGTPIGWSLLALVFLGAATIFWRMTD